MRPIFVIDEDQTLIIFCNAKNMHGIDNGCSVPKNTQIQTFKYLSELLERRCKMKYIFVLINHHISYDNL